LVITRERHAATATIAPVHRAANPHAQPRPGGGIPGRVRRDLRLSTIDGTLFSVMVGISEYYFPAFAIAMGMGAVVAGLVATVPMLCAALLQLVTPLAARRMGWCRTWVVIGAGVQTLSLIPLIIGAWMGGITAPLLFVLASVYHFGAMAGGPVWSTWLPMLVPARIREHYFAHRNRWCQAGILAGLLGGGALLKAFDTDPVRAFAALFGIAVLCRALSTVLLAVQSEPRPLPVTHRAVTANELASRVRHGPDGRLLSYAAAAAIAAQIAQPFFNPYVLGQLRFEEGHLAVLLASAFAGRILALPALGRLARLHGSRAVLWVGGIGLVPAVGAWLVSGNFWWLLAAQALGGAAWAAHELALFLMYVETIPENERASVLTKFNLMNALAMAGGSALGGFLLGRLGENQTAYIAVFAASVAARGAAIVLLTRVLPGRSAPDEAAITRAELGPEGLRA